MVSEIGDDISGREDLFELVNWALETGLWNGVPVHWQQGSDFQLEATRKVVELLFSKDPNSVDFLTMAAHLARLGASPENRFLLEKDIDELEISHNGIMLQVGFKKSCSKFWKKHGKTILIGAAVVAGVSGVAVVAVCFGPGAASAVATGLKIGIDGLMDNDGTDSTDERPSPIGCSSYPGPSPLEASDRVSHLGSETIPEIVVFSEDNVQIRDQFFSYEDVLKGRNNEQLVSTLRAQAEETFFKSNPLPSPPPSYKPWEMEQQMRDLFPTPEVSFPHSELLKSIEVERPPVGEQNYPNRASDINSEHWFGSSMSEKKESPILTAPIPSSELVQKPHHTVETDDAHWSILKTLYGTDLLRKETDFYERVTGEPLSVALKKIEEIRQTQQDKFPSFEPRANPLIGNIDQPTMHFHCGINNSSETTEIGGACLYRTLEEKLAIQPHWIHQDSMVHGLSMVALESIENSIAKTRELIPLLPGNGLFEQAVRSILTHSDIQKSINYETELLSQISREILQKNNPKLKQVHVIFSNAGHVMKETIKQLPSGV